MFRYYVVSNYITLFIFFHMWTKCNSIILRDNCIFLLKSLYSFLKLWKKKEILSNLDKTIKKGEMYGDGNLFFHFIVFLAL